MDGSLPRVEQSKIRTNRLSVRKPCFRISLYILLLIAILYISTSSVLSLAVDVSSKAKNSIVLQESAELVQTQTRSTVDVYKLSQGVDRNITIRFNELLETGGDINEANSNGSSLLMEAAYAGSPNMVETLLKHGANPNYINPSNMRTPLLLASIGPGDRVPHVTTLLKAGADPNVLGNRGITALGNAIVQNKIKMVQVLLDHNADPNILTVKKPGNKRPRYMFVGTIRNNQVEIIELLLKHGAKPGIDNIFIDAIYSGKDEIVASLIALGVDLHKADRVGDTPLHRAARRGNTKIITLLLEAGADVYRQNNSGRTPLHYANSPKVKKLLLQHMNR